MSEHDRRSATGRPGASSDDARQGVSGMATPTPGKQTLVQCLVQPMPAPQPVTAAAIHSGSPTLAVQATHPTATASSVGGVQRKGGEQPGDSHERHGGAVGAEMSSALVAGPAPTSAAPGTTGQLAPVVASSTEAATPPNGMWGHTFGEASTPVGK